MTERDAYLAGLAAGRALGHAEGVEQAAEVADLEALHLWELHDHTPTEQESDRREYRYAAESIAKTAAAIRSLGGGGGGGAEVNPFNGGLLCSN